MGHPRKKPDLTLSAIQGEIARLGRGSELDPDDVQYVLTTAIRIIRESLWAHELVHIRGLGWMQIVYQGARTRVIKKTGKVIKSAPRYAGKFWPTKGIVE